MRPVLTSITIAAPESALRAPFLSTLPPRARAIAACSCSSTTACSFASMLVTK